MEEPADADASPTPLPRSRPAPRSFHHLIILLACTILAVSGCAPGDREDALAHIRRTGRLEYGCDKEGGGPYAYPDPAAPGRVTGFEVELMGRLARGLGAEAVFAQGQWDQLLNVLDGRRIDAVVNGYEWTERRARDYLATRPYYVFQLQLMARRGGPIGSWADLLRRRGDGRRWRVGVLGGSAADTFAQAEATASVTPVSFTGATDAMLAVANGQIDATLQDEPAVRFYRTQYPSLAPAGPPVGRGLYVIYLRRGDRALKDALDREIGMLMASGDLRRLYERYDIWTEAQAQLAREAPEAPSFAGAARESLRGWGLVRKYGPLLVEAAGMTVLLSVASMPLAMAIGLGVALGRLYGPGPLRWALAGYVELLRGTPLMLQLFVLFYLLKLPTLVAGIGGLAINYSAYEAEIYRAGLQAIPAGQMEAALALGMSRRLALRRVIVPQAVRIVIPPVTNDFIALFKDTSVCSVITLVELSKQYQILANATGGVLEFALATSGLYLAMSLPLSWFARRSERRIAAGASPHGRAPA